MIAVICGYLDSLKPLADYTVEVNKREYCERHGYTLLIPRTINPKYVDPQSHAGGFSWSRLEYLRDSLLNYEWVWTVGADTLITNMTKKLEGIISLADNPQAEALPLPVCPFFKNSPAPPSVIKWKAPRGHRTTGKKHLLICGERVTALQADSFIMRGSQESVDYLTDILNQWPSYKHHPWVENQTMIDLRDKHASITHIVPQWMMNAYDYSRFYYLRPEYRSGTDCYGNRGQWRQGDFLIHWPASTLEQRLKFLEFYKPKIVR
jgi:hypothetical protein